jgi:DNA-binding transcriptional LysR family regulator
MASGHGFWTQPSASARLGFTADEIFLLLIMQEELVSDLEVLDYLELFNSTVEAAKLLGIAQSSCSRRYRSFSQRYGIGFDRIAERYSASSNLDILACLRQACQKLRIRQGCPRLTIGWQLGDLPIPELQEAGVVLPIRPMNSLRLLSLLEQRLLDVALMGMLELQNLLGQPLQRLRARRITLSPTMLCVPIGVYDLKLIAHSSHPLQGRSDLNPEELGQYPSPALPLGMAPTLMGSLQPHGLANQPCGLSEYQEQAWEGFARDGVGLSYCGPHRLAHLERMYELNALPYKLGIQDCIGFVGHRDVLADPAFRQTFRVGLRGLRSALTGCGAEIFWLS